MTSQKDTDEVEAAILQRIADGESLRISGGPRSGKSRIMARIAAMPGVIHLDANAASAQRSAAQTAWSLLPLQDFHAPGPFRLGDMEKAVLRAAQIILIDNAGQLRVDKLQELRDALFLCPTGYGPFAGRRLIIAHDPDGLPAPRNTRRAADFRRFYGGEQGIEASRYFQDLPEVVLPMEPRAEMQAQPDAVALDAIHDLPAGAVLVTTPDIAREANEDAMMALPGGVYRLPAVNQGTFTGGRPTIPLELVLKRNARLILLGEGPEGEWRAGDTGILLSCERNPAGDPVAIVGHRDGRELRVTQQEIHSLRHTARYLSGAGFQLERVSTGSFRQLPIVPGWAVPATALNGMSLDTPYVDLSELEDPDLLRVVAARARQPQGLQPVIRLSDDPVPAE